jgi:hypothetical protein
MMGRMSGLSDTITLGLVLILVFGSACLYLYTRIQQAETKINLLESILLDLKMSNELKSYPILSYPAKPEDETAVEINNISTENTHSSMTMPIKPFMDEGEVDHLEQTDLTEAEPSVFETISESVKDDTKKTKITPNYEAMTLDELRAIAKQRSISKSSTLRRAQLIDALKHSDESHVSVLDSFTDDSMPPLAEVSISA